MFSFMHSVSSVWGCMYERRYAWRFMYSVSDVGSYRWLIDKISITDGFADFMSSRSCTPSTEDKECFPL